METLDLTTTVSLITGGATGIGLALARRMLNSGGTVLVCGRRAEALEAARTACPGLLTLQADVATSAQRQRLARQALELLPNLNVLVNNAGVQRRLELVDQPAEWEQWSDELAINLEAPIHLSSLLLPHLRQQPRATIVNVTSGLAFCPMAAAPIYSASKAALHSYTLSLRRQLRDTSVGVVEIAPPAVNTDLGGVGLHTFGADVDEFADSVMARLVAGELEVGFGTSEKSRQASRAELDQLFARMNG